MRCKGIGEGEKYDHAFKKKVNAREKGGKRGRWRGEREGEGGREVRGGGI